MHKYKKIIISVIVIIVVIVIAVAFLNRRTTGDVSNVKTSKSHLNNHSKEDIERAMDEVKDVFREEYPGCDLKNLYYDGNDVRDKEEGYSDEYNGKQVIILYSDFYVGFSGDISLNPNSEYTKYQWILVKIKNKWMIVDSGYG